MEKEQKNIALGDPQLVNKIVEEYMSQGHFDQLRKKRMTDLDTMSSYESSRHRIESTVQSFLVKQSWKPNLVKNQLRDALKRKIMNAPYLRPDVRKIVDQLVNRSNMTELRPQLEEIAKSLIGVDENAQPDVEVTQESMDTTQDALNVADSDDESQMVVVTEEEAVPDAIGDETESTVESSLVNAMEDLVLPETTALSEEVTECTESIEATETPSQEEEEPSAVDSNGEAVEMEQDELLADLEDDSDHSLINQMSPISAGTPTPPPSPSPLVQSVLTTTKRASDFVGKIPKLNKNVSKTVEEEQNTSKPPSPAPKNEEKARTSDKKDERSSSDKSSSRSRDGTSSSGRDKEKRIDGEKSSSSNDKTRYPDKSRDKYKDRSSTRDKERDHSDSRERSRRNDKSRDRDRDRTRGEDGSRNDKRDSHSSRDRDRKSHRHDDEKSHRSRDSTRDRREGDKDRDRERKDDRNRDRKDDQRDRDRKDDRNKSQSKKDDRDRERSDNGRSQERRERDRSRDKKSSRDGANRRDRSRDKRDRKETNSEKEDTKKDEKSPNGVVEEPLSEIQKETENEEVAKIFEAEDTTLSKTSEENELDTAVVSTNNSEPSEVRTRYRKRIREISIDSDSKKGSVSCDVDIEVAANTGKLEDAREVEANDENSSESAKTVDDVSRDSQDSESSKERGQRPPRYKIATVSPILTRSKGRKTVAEKATDSIQQKRTSKRVGKKISFD